MTDGSGTTTYTYSTLGQLTKTVQGDGSTISYGYDLNGNQATITYPNGKSVTNAYDAVGHLVKVTDWLGNSTSYRYDANGNRIVAAYSNGVTATNSYDSANQLMGIADTHGVRSLASYSYQRNSDGLVTQASTTGPNRGVVQYSYTALNQLAKANAARYSYDTAGNLTGYPRGITGKYNAGSQLTIQSGIPGRTYTYNAEGQRTSSATAWVTTNYRYDQAGNLISVTPTITAARVATSADSKGS